MRPRIFLLSILVAVATGVWFVEYASARRHETKLITLRAQHRELVKIRTESDRIREALRSLNTTTVESASKDEPPAIAKPIPSPASFALGEWMPSASWSNRGQSTPRAALETTLWAAAGGDVMAMQSLIELDPAVRSKANQLLDRLPPATRSSYVTSEGLIASMTMKNIPLTAAQIVWYHESDDDHAAVGVLFGNADRTVETSLKLPANKQDNSPPTLSDNRTTGMALLALHRSPAGWRLVVPISAIDRIAAEFNAPPR